VTTPTDPEEQAMARIVSNFFISMDGVVERPDQWHFPYFDDEMGEIVGAGMANTAAILMGHRLYDEWSQYWPAQGDQDFGAVINGTQKYVLSHDAFDPDWANTTVISGPDDASVAEQVRALKERTDGDITMSGSATTVRWLIAQGLLDELALLVHPIAVARGQRLFEDTGTVPLTLLSSATLPTGVLHVRYAPA
jgi:dihydrofolate reductase